METIDVDSYDVNGFSRRRPSAPRNGQQSVPKPMLLPRQQPRQPQQQQPRQSQQQQQQQQPLEYPVIAQFDLTLDDDEDDEEEGEIIENDHQNASNSANPAGNGNINLLNNQNQNGIELDVLPLETLEVKKERIVLELKQEDLEPVSDEDENELTPSTSKATPDAFSTSLENVSEDEMVFMPSNPPPQSLRNGLSNPHGSNESAHATHSNNAPSKFNTTNLTARSISPSIFEMSGLHSSNGSYFLPNQSSTTNRTGNASSNANKFQQPNQTPRSSASNTSTQSINNSPGRVQRVQSLENVSDDEDVGMDATPSNLPQQLQRNELQKPHSPSKSTSASKSNEKRVVYTKNRTFNTNRPISSLNKTVQSSASNMANIIPQSAASNASMQSQNRAQTSPNQRLQSHTPSASARSPNSNKSPHSFTANRSQFLQNETRQSIDSNRARAKKSPIRYPSPPTTNQNGIQQFSYDLNTPNLSTNHVAQFLRSYGIVVETASESQSQSQPIQLNQTPHSYIPAQATAHITPYDTLNHRVHSNGSNRSSQRSPSYAPVDGVSNDMLSQNAGGFAQQKTPIRERAPQTPESGIEASDTSSDFELDLHRTNEQANLQPQRIQNIASNATHFNANNLNNNNQVNHESSSNNGDNNSSNSNQQPHLLQSENDLDDLIHNSFVSGVKEWMQESEAKKRKSSSPISCDSSSSNTGDGLMQPSKNQPKNIHQPSSSGSGSGGSKRQRMESTSETETTSDDDVGTDNTQTDDPSYEPNTEDMDDDNRADENDEYDSDCSSYSRETQPFEMLPMKSERKNDADESSIDSEETIVDFAPYFESDSVEMANEVELSNDEIIDDDTELLVPVPEPEPVPIPSTSVAYSKRNIDKTLYLCSEKAKTCPLCRKTYKRHMVHHFKTKHPNDEVYVSRISSKMVDYIAPENENRRTFNKCIKYHYEHLEAVCVFCEEEKIFDANYWIDHMRSHTGEYKNYCACCETLVCFSKHCRIATTKIDNFNLRHQDMYAYRCNECNYVQIDKKNMKAHVGNHHHMYVTDEDIDEYRFKLLPAFCNVHKQRNSNEQQQIQGAIQASLPRNPSQSIRDFLRQPQEPFNPFVAAQTKQQHQQQPRASNQQFEILEMITIPPASQVQSTSHQPSAPIRAGTAESQATNSNPILKFKKDPGAAKLLLDAHNAFEPFKTMKNFNVVVRPYIDEDYARKLNINVITQFSLYKCMHDACLFACDSEENWRVHMEQHSNLIDILGVEQKLKSEYKEQLLKFCECPYCGYEPKRKNNTQCRSLDAVCRHMEMEHLRNTIQCAHCYYRTNEMDNIIFHMEKYHRDRKRDILLYSRRREFQDSDLEELKQCDQHITGIKCNLPLGSGSQEKCTKEFVCFNTLRSHQIVVHGAKRYMCSCHTHLEMKTSVMLEHFSHGHSVLKLQEFQCLHCEEGFEEIKNIREHMFEIHPSKFLLIGARRNVQNNSKRDNDDEDNIQFVYIGDSKDYSAYKLYTCANHEALNSMDPNELNPNKLYEAQKLQNTKYSNIKAAFSGSLPPITFSENYKKELDFVTYEQYQQKTSKGNKKSSKTVKSKEDHKQASCSQTKPPKIDKPNISMVTLPTDKIPSKSKPSTSSSVARPKQSPEPIASTSKHYQNSTKPVVTVPATKSPPSPATSTQISTEFICITHEIFENLSQVIGYQSRLCCICQKFFKIENETQLQSYLMHLKHEHPCKKAEKMQTAKELFDHRMQYHRNQQITALKIERCNDEDPQNQWLVHSIINARFQCNSCTKRFDSTKEIDLHNTQQHRGIFERIEIVYESMVIKSTDLNQPTNSKSECIPMVLLTNFKCDRCQTTQTFRQKSAAIEHHNQCHAGVTFECSLKRYAYDSAANMDIDCSVHREYLFKCFHCKLHFASLPCFEIHNKCTDHKINPQFELEKLVKCSRDKMIGTFRQVKKHHTSKHANDIFTPVNLYYPNQCGLCEFKFDDLNELNGHYQRRHPNIPCEPITNDLLDSMELKDVNVGECHYIPECCHELKCKGIAQIIHHVSNCNRRFTCTKCPKMPRSLDLNKFINHCQESHGQTKHDIFAELHNLKNFQRLLSDMHVIFPNGLHVLTVRIIDTDFYVQKLMPQMTQIIMNNFNKEKRYHSFEF